MGVDGSNYLIPVDAKLERDTDVYDEALSLDRVLVAIEPATRLRLVILDACRDNPFARSMKRTLASRAIAQGLGKIEPSSPNMLIAYSAKAGSTALDGDARNSPFTLALAKHLTTPGLDVRRAFGFVRDEVLKTTGNKQEPFVYGSLGGDDVPLVPAEKAKQVAQEQAAAAEQKRAAAEIADKLSEKIASINTAADRGSASPEPAEKAQGDRQGDKQGEKPVNVASLTAGSPPADLTKSVQIELRRVGCLTADADGEWNSASQRSMALFNRHAKTRFHVKLASADALDAIKLKPARVCPMICQHGFEADGDRCSKIVCGEGSFLNDDNECEKRRAKTPTAPRDREDRNYRNDRGDRPVLERPMPEARVSTPQPSGQIVCNGGG